MIKKMLEETFASISWGADYLIAPANFLPAVTGDDDPFRVLDYMSLEEDKSQTKDQK